MTDENKCPFKIGDRVKHRASGEIGIVIWIHRRCTKHSAFQHMQLGDIGKCEHEDTGRVNLSAGFQGDVEVAVMELEAADD